MKTTDVDIIYINYNSTPCLTNAIDSLVRWTPVNIRLNITVVDNASTDNVNAIKHAFPTIRLIINPRNVGFGAAINQALAHCHATYLVLLNPDSIIFDDFLSTVIEYLETNPCIGILGPSIFNEDGSLQGSARAFPTPLTSLFGRNSPITKMFPNNSITRANILNIGNDVHTPMEVDWVSGACMVVRKTAMQAVGGFDERFFLYWEDTDLCRRMWDAGWKVVYFPHIKVIHSVGKSSNTRPLFANFQFHKSCYRLYEKYVCGPYSIFMPMVGIALMLRFLIAAGNNYVQSLWRQVPRRLGVQASVKPTPRRQLRILRIISRMNIGGPSIHVKNLTQHLDRDRYDTRLLTGTISRSEGDMRYITRPVFRQMVHIPELQREIDIVKDGVAFVKLLRLIRRFHPDIVHSHTSKAGALSRASVLLCNLFQRQKIITVHTFHGNVLDGYFGKLKSFVFLRIERLLARFTDRIVAISDSQRWELLNVYRIGTPKAIKVIKLGFDLGSFLTYSTLRGHFRQRLNLPPDTLLIGIIGRMVPIKNHRMFLDAGKRLIDGHPEREIRLVLVGDGEERPRLERYVSDIGLTEKVVFHGWEKNIPMVYADLDILALTSLNEGTPVSIIEAMAARVPIVTTGVGGVKDLLGEMAAEQPPGVAFKLCQRGIFCPRNDAGTFSLALTYMIQNGYLAQDQRLRAARDYVAKHYSLDRLVADMERLYDHLIRPIRVSDPRPGSCGGPV